LTQWIVPVALKNRTSNGEVQNTNVVRTLQLDRSVDSVDDGAIRALTVLVKSAEVDKGDVRCNATNQ